MAIGGVTMSSEYRIIKMKELVELVGISRSYIYALQHRGEFPKPFKLVQGGRSTGYLQSDIDDWVKSRIAASARGCLGKDAP